MAAMGQPLLGDGVLCASCANVPARDKPFQPAASNSNTAVMRAGSQLSTSSARAAHLPAQAQLRPLYTPG